MTYDLQWRMLSARIRGLTSAAELHSRHSEQGDMHGVVLLREHARKLLAELSKFFQRFGDVIPGAARSALQEVVQKGSEFLLDGDQSSATKRVQTWAAFLMFASLETELTYILSDDQLRIRSTMERAFAHLQRLIVVDQMTRKIWNDGFKKGEVECEKLGAVQLLHHGIWAFKVGGAGERTDLVFQDTVSDLSEQQRFADGMVLTEWKIGNGVNAESKFSEARRQAQSYACGVLAGAELAGYRYAVVVSEHQVKLPPDVEEQGIVYRHINIAVSPRTPSRVSR